jgi:lipopolysaccharide transport system permease protein
MRVLGFDQQDVKLLGVFWGMNVRDKYLGSRLGRVWAVVNPLLMLALFTFVFGFVFKMRVPGAETNLSYAIWLISGYGPWLATSEALMAAAMSVVASTGLVKNMAFKTEILPVAASMTGFLPLGVCLGFLTALLIMDGNTPSWHVVFVVVLVVVQFALVIALGFFASAITVFVRDFGIALPNLLMGVLFATPIFYPLTSTPPIVQTMSLANPFYILVEGYRRALIYHHTPDLTSLLYVAGLSAVLAVVGLKLFQRYKGYFEARL